MQDSGDLPVDGMQELWCEYCEDPILFQCAHCQDPLCINLLCKGKRAPMTHEH